MCIYIYIYYILYIYIYIYIYLSFLTQVFFCEFCEITKNTFFIEHLWVTASAFSKVFYIFNISISIFSRDTFYLLFINSYFVKICYSFSKYLDVYYKNHFLKLCKVGFLEFVIYFSN